MELNKVRTIYRRIAVPMGGDSITLECDFGILTPDFIEKFCSSANQWDATIDLFLRVVKGWDVTDAGRPCKMTREILSSLPSVTITTILSAILRDYTEQATGVPASMRSFLED
jgi:hypothetical protein